MRKRTRVKKSLVVVIIVLVLTIATNLVVDRYQKKIMGK